MLPARAYKKYTGKSLDLTDLVFTERFVDFQSSSGLTAIDEAKRQSRLQESFSSNHTGTIQFGLAQGR